MSSLNFLDNTVCDEGNQQCIDPCDACSDNEICEGGKCVFDCNTCAALEQVCNGNKDGCVAAGPCSKCPDGWDCDEATATCIDPCLSDGDIFEYKWTVRNNFVQAQVIFPAVSRFYYRKRSLKSGFSNIVKIWDPNTLSQDPQIKPKTMKLSLNL